jgi:hypothetical protein
VVKLQSELDLVRSKIKAAEAMLAQTQQRVKQGVSTAEEVQVAEANLLTAKAELAKLEAEIPALLGKRTGVESLTFTPDGGAILWGGTDGSVRIWDATTGKIVWGKPKQPSADQVAADMATRLQKALDAPVEIDFSSVPIEDALTHLFRQVGDIPLVVRLEDQASITLKAPLAIPLGAALQMIQDRYPDSLEFVVRDYGILVTERNKLPNDTIITVHDFWKLARKKAAEKPNE